MRGMGNDGVVVFGRRGCFAGVAGESLLSRDKSNQKRVFVDDERPDGVKTVQGIARLPAA